MPNIESWSPCLAIKFQISSPEPQVPDIRIKSWHTCSRYGVLQLSSQYWVLMLEFWLSSSIPIYRMSSPDSCVLDSKLQISSSEFGVLHSILRAGHWALNIEFWTLNILFWTSWCCMLYDWYSWVSPNKCNYTFYLFDHLHLGECVALTLAVTRTSDAGMAPIHFPSHSRPLPLSRGLRMHTHAIPLLVDRTLSLSFLVIFPLIAFLF